VNFAQTQKIAKEQAAKDAIYEATLRIIARQVGGPLKMQDIAAAAGIATGTLYNYFKNKVQLLTFVDQRLHELILRKIETVTNSDTAPINKLKAVIWEIMQFSKEHHIVFDLAEKLGVKSQIPLTEKRKGINQACGYIARIISEGITSRQFRQVNAEKTAKHVFSAIIGLIEIRSWLQDYNNTAEADELTEFILSNLTKQPG